MEWLGLGLVGAVVFFWWLGREPSPSAQPVARPDAGHEQPSRRAGPGVEAAGAGTGVGLLGAEVLRRATDMNDPDGTFMDGYVAGRLTERAELNDEMDARAARDVQDESDTSHRWSGADDEAWDLDDAADDDVSDEW